MLRHDALRKKTKKILLLVAFVFPSGAAIIFLWHRRSKESRKTEKNEEVRDVIFSKEA
jgi:flagellar basal body-associated protein FliL